ncbi:FG-GAP repeat protein [Pseudovibrio axinellae]|uniref:FG-GAP repeat protein n=1 Tax=Pseudovibrio axinellae TaxID=989403 RepID=A0A165XE30_9HYPH|nr:FG-GAP-like repeat-containing protein [Pseudovibrio axinellae]KZL17619.1 FG-GAP repeat protein [Pseudovibrio axinellae]SER46052.1 FG-GAP repeat-containing protein [Pseudovibrio axinellae]
MPKLCLLPTILGSALLILSNPALADLDQTCTDELVLGRDAGSNQRWFVYGDSAADFIIQSEGGDGWGIARETLSVAVGDIDGDGRDEFAIGRDGAVSQSVRVLLFDDASAGFSQIDTFGEEWGAGRRATSIAFGNVDDDAALEMAVGRDGPTGFRYRIYDDRDANFITLHTGGTTWGSDRRVTALAFGDLDGDGREELVVGRSGGAVARPRWLVLDDAEGNFAELFVGGDTWGAARRVTALATGDVDGDGIAELAIGRDTGPNFHWQVLDGIEGNFATLASGGDGWGGTRRTNAVALGDVDGDGLDELIIGRNAGSGPRILTFDDALRNFTSLGELASTWGITRSVRALAVGDVDGDFVDEIAVGRNGGSGPRWMILDDRFQRFSTLRQGGDGWGVGRAVNALALRSTRTSGPDRDEDGLFDSWEQSGIDVNCDGVVDYTPPDADPDRKNIYVEMDYMLNHLPRADAINDVIAAFAAAPNQNPDGTTGIDLLIDLDEQLPETLDITTWTDFDDIRDAQFGTVAERSAPNAVALLSAKALIYRYALNAHTRDGGSSSGRAKRGNFVVTLGGSAWASDASGHSVGSRRQQAGTIMHELGHTLGLGHGGGDSTNCKPNYLSVMNYSFQTRHIPNPTLPGPRLDYSASALPNLNEAALSEALGVQDGTDNTFFGTDGTSRIAGAGMGPIDWNQQNGIEAGTVTSDANFTSTSSCDASPNQVLAGWDDWSNLFLPSRSAPGNPHDTELFPEDELTGEEAALFEACADGEDTARCTQPPYEYAAKFVCGIQDDPRTLRLTRGVYGTTVNIHNPWDKDAIFYKKVAVAYPPAEQAPGEILQMGKDLLRYDEALKVDCEDIRARAFQGAFPTSYVEGFVVIQSFESLDVTGVYTSAAIVDQTQGCCSTPMRTVQNSGMEIIQIKERRKPTRPDPGSPDLLPEPVFGPPPDDAPGTFPQNYCGPLPAGSPVQDVQLHLRVRNQGDAAAGASTTRVIFSPSSQFDPIVGTVDLATPALAAGAAHQHLVDIPDGCFPGSGSGCNFRITADAAEPEQVIESNEANNVDQSGCPGIVP